jgi:hypothetical protein
LVEVIQPVKVTKKAWSSRLKDLFSDPMVTLASIGGLVILITVLRMYGIF